MNPLPRLVSALLTCLTASCASAVTTGEVADLMDVQREAWNRGDLRTFVAYYHPTMTFCGGTGVTRGTENLLARYEKGYPTAKERGELSFDVLEVRPLGSGVALVIGEYRIKRDDPSSGFFSLVVQRTSDGLRIIHDHTSETPPPDAPEK